MDDVLHRQDQKTRKMTDNLFCNRKVTDARPGKGEERTKFIKKLTHLRLQDQGIKTIENLDHTRKLQALYLNSNVITCMNGLQHKYLNNLIQLDLQDNDITVMEGLDCLSGVRRLSLARNCIAFITGLEHCPRLEQFDMSGQRLVEGSTGVEFDETSIDAMSETLISLNASNCGLMHVEHIACLDALTSLDISNNAVPHVDGFANLLCSTSGRTGRNRQLRTLLCDNNPAMIQGGPRVRDTLVVMAESLRCLNGKDIEPRQRQFLLTMEARKNMPKKKKQRNKGEVGSNVLVEVGVGKNGTGRPMGFEDRGAYNAKNHRAMPSGNKPMPGSMISGSGKPHFR